MEKKTSANTTLNPLQLQLRRLELLYILCVDPACPVSPVSCLCPEHAASHSPRYLHDSYLPLLSLKPTADSAAKEGILGILVGHFPVLRGVSVLRAAPSCGHRAPGWRQGLRHRHRERPWPAPASPVSCPHHGENHVDVRVPAGGSARIQPRSQLALHIPYAAAASSPQRQTP